MNFLDVIVLIPVLWGAFKGFKNGLISEVGTIAALILGIWAAINLSGTLSEYIQEYTSIAPEYQQITAFATTFVIVVVACFCITKIIVHFFKTIKILWLDKLCGIVFGMSKYLIVIAFLFYLANSLIESYATKPIEVVETSVLFKPMAKTAESFVSGKIKVPHIEKNDTFEEKFKNED